ncbi:MAG: hypothetical protein ACOYVD_15190 [Bacillota bacterium]
MKDKLGMDQKKAFNQVKKEKQIDKDLRNGEKIESAVDPVDTKTGIGEAESSLKLND